MDKQVIVSGGLGNQMFQYAFYRSMKAHGVKCVLNTDLYSRAQMHNGYELDRVFGIRDEIANNNLLESLIIRSVIRSRKSAFCYREANHAYNPSVYKSKAKVFIGTWINEAYFKSISGEIKDAFSFIGIDAYNMALSNTMHTENSVSIHIRRGDYLKLPSYNVCDEAYYKRAITYMKDRIDSPIFYVFSDDSTWAYDFMKKMDLPFQVITHNKGVNSYKDLFLMSSCRNNINANSTFSWWAAWLNKNSSKIVIMPERWTLKSDDNPACAEWRKL